MATGVRLPYGIPAKRRRMRVLRYFYFPGGFAARRRNFRKEKKIISARPDPAARSVSALSDLLYPACSRQERKRWIIAGPGGEHVEICGNGRRRKRSEYHKIERFFFLFFSTKCIKKIHKTGIIFQNISSLKPLNVVNILI